MLTNVQESIVITKLITNFAGLKIIKIMAFIKKKTIHAVLFFMFLFLIQSKLYSQVEYINDSIIYHKQYINLLIYHEQNPDPIKYRDTVILNSQFLPIIFDVNRLMKSYRLIPENPLQKPLIPQLSISKYKLFSDYNDKYELYRSSYNYLIKNNTKQIKYTTADFTGVVETIEPMRQNMLKSLFKIDYDFDNEKVGKPDRYQPKRRYWIYKGNHKIQLSQNYLSENWYKGGMKNLNLLNRHDITFNYNKNRFQSNNIVEWRLNLYTNPNDTLRMYRIGEDLVRTYSNVGFQAFDKWYYSVFIEMKTQVFKNFIENSEKTISSALSPLYINMGLLGMRYQIDKTYPKVKGKKINFNMEISPLSIEYITVLNKDIDQTRFGIKKDEWHLTNIGSTVNSKLIFNINRNVNLTSRFYYFTNYEKVTAEFENTLNLPINRYFSTSLFLFFRYDDNPKLKKDKNLGYFQLYELLSFGFNYNW